MTLTLYAALALMVASLADVATTLGALQRGAREANPVVRFLMEKVGHGWIPIKMIPPAVALYLATEFPQDQRLATLYLVLSTAMMLVAFNNYRLERQP